MAKTVSVTVTTNGPEAGSITVETHGFNGKGCQAIHDAFSSGGDRKTFEKKPEYNQTQTQTQTAR